MSPRSPRRRRRLVIVALATVGTLLPSWVVFAIAVIGHPSLAEHPEPADAVVVLGPSNKRVTQAVSLAQGLGIDHLVLSIGDFAIQRETTCARPGLDVTCFVPTPYSTSGEAAEIGVLAQQNDWHSIIVIAATAQASRARYLIGQCFSGTIQMVAGSDAESRPGGFGWLYQALYQTAAWAKAFVDDPCRPAADDHPGQAPA